MTEPDLQLLQRLIREMQADMRTIRSENALHFASGAQLAMAFNDRIAQFEVMIGERLARIEDLMKR